MNKIKEFFGIKPKTIETPEKCRIIVTEKRYDDVSQSLIRLVEIYFEKYGFRYSVIEEDYDSMLGYHIEIDYKDKDYVEVLLNRVFNNNGKDLILIKQYERWLKTERIRRKILNI